MLYEHLIISLLSIAYEIMQAKHPKAMQLELDKLALGKGLLLVDQYWFIYKLKRKNIYIIFFKIITLNFLGLFVNITPSLNKVELFGKMGKSSYQDKTLYVPHQNSKWLDPLICKTHMSLTMVRWRPPNIDSFKLMKAVHMTVTMHASSSDVCKHIRFSSMSFAEKKCTIVQKLHVIVMNPYNYKSTVTSSSYM